VLEDVEAAEQDLGVTRDEAPASSTVAMTENVTLRHLSPMAIMRM